MATLGELTDQISLRLVDESNTSVSRSTIQSVINDSIRYYKTDQFWFNTVAGVVALTAGNNVFPIPSGAIYTILNNEIHITYNSANFLVKKVQPFEYDWLNYEYTGMPYAFAVFANEYRLYPYPDQNYTATVRYIKDYDDFATDGSDDDSSNDFTVYAPSMIRSDALARIYAEIKQDDTAGARFANIAGSEYQNLINRTNDQSRTGSLSITDSLLEV